jgi:hypothetical protein
MSYVIAGGPSFSSWGLSFLYEKLPDLELFGVEESEPQMGRLLDLALLGKPLSASGTVYLDVRWREPRVRT